MRNLLLIHLFALAFIFFVTSVFAKEIKVYDRYGRLQSIIVDNKLYDRYGKYQGRIIGGDFVNSQGKPKNLIKKKSIKTTTYKEK